jgi:hypothetical protein
MLAVVPLVLFACKSPESTAESLVERAWKARVSGDVPAFESVVVAGDKPHIESSGAVLNVGGLDASTRAAMEKSLVVKPTAEKVGDELKVTASVTWLPPGPGGVVTETHHYYAVETDDGWKLDLGLRARADIARKLGEARAAIRAGRPDAATELLDAIDPSKVPRSESAMLVGAIEATRESVESADVLAELRQLMEAHHKAEDPAQRANLVKKARELGIEKFELPDDVATLWEDAKSGDETAQTVAELGEELRIEADASKEGHGAIVAITVQNGNDVRVFGLTFEVDLIDGDGVRLHRLSHQWEGPVAAGSSGKTSVRAPSVPPEWDGAVNVRIAAVSSEP